MKGHLNVVQYLVERDPTLLTALDSRGWTCAVLACVANKLNVLQFLISREKSLMDAVDEHGNNMYQIASQRGHAEIVNYLDELSPKWRVTGG